MPGDDDRGSAPRWLTEPRQPSAARKIVVSGDPAVRRVLVHRVGKLPRQTGQKLVTRQPGLLLQRRQHVRTDRLLELARRDLLVGAGPHPAVRQVSPAALLEAIDKVAEPAAEQAPGAGSAEAAQEAAQPAGAPAAAQQASEAAAGAGGLTGPPRIGRPGTAPEHLSDLVPVLVSGHRQKAQKRCH